MRLIGRVGGFLYTALVCMMIGMAKDLELIPAAWRDYRRFVDLCCVPTMPFPGGPCWIVKGDVGFVGYNFAYRNNGRRLSLFAEHKVYGKAIDLDWLNGNIRQLNRVMVRPSYRGRGIATALVSQTLGLVGVPYIECLTFAELIRNILLRVGFVDHGVTKTGECRYYLWSRDDRGGLGSMGEKAW